MLCLKALWRSVLTGGTGQALIFYLNIEQKLCKVKIFQLQSMLNVNMYWSKACLQEFCFFVSSLDIQLEQSENNSPVQKKSVAGGEIQQFICCYIIFENVVKHLPSSGSGLSMVNEAMKNWRLQFLTLQWRILNSIFVSIYVCMFSFPKFSLP